MTQGPIIRTYFYIYYLVFEESSKFYMVKMFLVKISIPLFGQPLHMTGWLQKAVVAVQKGNREIALESSSKKAP